MFKAVVTNGDIKVLGALDDSIYSMTYVSMISKVT